MLAILREISVTCFFTSYLVVLVLELLRLVGRIPGRGLAVVIMIGLGLFTHVSYLILRAVGQSDDVARLATWTDWSLLLALGLMVCFTVLYFRRPETIVSFFFLPTVLLLIGLAIALRGQPPFSRGEAFEVWRNVHAVGMAAGSAAVTIGFLAGIMYLVQSWRLKNKKAGSSLRLPTLETLQRLNRSCLLFSTIAVGLGVIAGVVMNLNRWGQVGWTDGGVLFSLALFIWLMITSIIEISYATARRGRKIAYVTLASFGFLVLAMYGVVRSSHGSTSPSRIPSESMVPPTAESPVANVPGAEERAL